MRLGENGRPNGLVTGEEEDIDIVDSVGEKEDWSEIKIEEAKARSKGGDGVAGAHLSDRSGSTTIVAAETELGLLELDFSLLGTREEEGEMVRAERRTRHTARGGLSREGRDGKELLAGGGCARRRCAAPGLIVGADERRDGLESGSRAGVVGAWVALWRV